MHATLPLLQATYKRELLREDPAGRSIRVADHCYGCSAGQGSSCGGAQHGKTAP